MKRIGLIGLIMAAVLTFSSCRSDVGKAMPDGSSAFGVNNVSVIKSGGSYLLNLDVLGIGGYDVHILDAGEGIISGEKTIDNDRSLGAYCYMITLHDAHFSKEFTDKYKLNEASRIKDTAFGYGNTLHIRPATPPDDSMVALYVWSEKDLKIAECEYTAIDELQDSISIKIK